MIILASGSPRRRELLSGITRNFKVIVPDAEEAKEGDRFALAENNAAAKGRAVKEGCDLLIACDTVVAYGDKIYGKPGTEERAVETLRELNGKTHSVVSGVYLRYGGTEEIYSVESSVKLKSLTESEIRTYVRNRSPLDKAGAYGIQDGEIVESYEGDYDNIVGLPLCRIREVIKKLGL